QCQLGNRTDVRIIFNIENSLKLPCRCRHHSSSFLFPQSSPLRRIRRGLKVRNPYDLIVFKYGYNHRISNADYRLSSKTVTPFLPAHFCRYKALSAASTASSPEVKPLISATPADRVTWKAASSRRKVSCAKLSAISVSNRAAAVTSHPGKTTRNSSPP